MRLISLLLCILLMSAVSEASSPDVSPQREGTAAINVLQQTSFVTFTAKSDRGTVSYRVKPQEGLASIEGKYGDGRWIPLGKGFQIAVVDVGPVWEPVRSAVQGHTWTGIYRQQKSGLTLTVKADLSGGTLRVRLSTDRGTPLNIEMPAPEGAANVDVPYLLGYDGSIKYLPKDKLFFSCLVDWTKTNSSVPVPRISYQANLAKKTAPVSDLIAFTLSDDIDCVLPSIPNPVSPYRKEIAGRMIVEIWWYGNFDRIGDMLDLYHAYGMDQILAIVHRWQRYGYDTKFPDIFPPDPQRGGLETLRDVIKRATGYGQRVALHENYVDVYPDAPSWNEADLMRLANGDFQAAWANARHCSPSRMKAHAEKVMPVIKRELGTNACFLDVHSAQAPWFRTDFRADVPYSGQMKGTRLFTNELWAYARKVYDGPVLGEGSYDWVHSGCLDGVEAQVGGKGARFFVDFVLQKVRPQVINHGVGYYERWSLGYDKGDWMLQAPDPTDMDDYRITEIAYGHAANIGGQVNRIIELAAKEYYMVRPLTQHQVDAHVAEIMYHDGTAWLTPSQAILRKSDEVRRVRVTYDNGLVIHVNRSGAPWSIDKDTAIGPIGIVARGKGITAFTNNPQGFWYDYYGDGESYYLDPRNSDWNIDHLGQVWAKETVRVNDGERIIAQGPIETNTAVSLTKVKDGWRLRFFPQGRAGKVRINIAQIDSSIAKAVALDREGRELSETGDVVTAKDGVMIVKHMDGRVWSYILRSNR